MAQSSRESRSKPWPGQWQPCHVKQAYHAFWSWKTSNKPYILDKQMIMTSLWRHWKRNPPKMAQLFRLASAGGSKLKTCGQPFEVTKLIQNSSKPCKYYSWLPIPKKNHHLPIVGSASFDDTIADMTTYELLTNPYRIVTSYIIVNS